MFYSWDKVELRMKTLKNGKLAGRDEFKGMMIKNEGELGIYLVMEGRVKLSL